MRYLALFVFCIFQLTSGPITVVVIGGGPTGLGAAIEARNAGADVVVVEKRGEYTRQNTLFLFTVTLEIFEEWNAPIPLMEELQFRNERRGYVLIKDLETTLYHHLDRLGVHRIQGEFVDFAEDTQAAIIRTAHGQMVLPYDILVGADGVHSRVREKMGIPCHCLGRGIGCISVVDDENPAYIIGAQEGSHDQVFARRCTVPSATIIFMQSRPNSTLTSLDHSEFIRIAAELGWQERSNPLFVIENIPIVLQHAAAFSDPAKSTILLGDAAAATSFLQGAGANFSFKTAKIAGELFRNWPAFDRFDRAMKKAVDGLIQPSLPLFNVTYSP